MKRRAFIRKAGLATASVFAAPYLLPSGRLFAASGNRKVKHVVFCLFAGGIRNLESVHQKEGALMPNTLGGTEKISADIFEGMDALPAPNGKPLSAFGTLYKEFRYNSAQTIHFNGHATAIMGAYSPLVQIMQPLPEPTLFELYRKHNSPTTTALNSWWISDQGGPFTYLNYSAHPDYGPAFGANMLEGASFFRAPLEGNSIIIDEEKWKNLSEISSLFSRRSQNRFFSGVENREEDRRKIESFLSGLVQEQSAGKTHDPWNLGKGMNEDIANMYLAIRVLKEFKPELLVVNMQHSDIAHSNFTQYCNNLRKADFALKQMWDAIQSTPGLKDDTVLIAAPEFGRNLNPNTLMDSYGRKALDHTGEPMSREIFCLLAGPPNVINQGIVIRETKGDSIDIVPTIANLLGFDSEIPKGMLQGKILKEALI